MIREVGTKSASQCPSKLKMYSPGAVPQRGKLTHKDKRNERGEGVVGESSV